jgi:ubiquinone/menaquinone biosynthesis C-methylase UbiE
MKTSKEIKDAVKEKYGQVAKGEISSVEPKPSCCGTDGQAIVNLAPRYGEADQAAIPEGADLGLGCGTPAAYADMKEGMTVLDLGSGAGIDCFVASRHVGKSGKVIGVDMTEEMIRKADENKAKIHAANVDFRLGEIENLPVEDSSVDRVISNCVINLVPNKENAFGEIFRVLRSGGKFTVSDIVVDGQITEEERRDASLWAGCISGALDKQVYIGIIKRTGFQEITMVSEKKYDYPLRNNSALYSITISASKP